MNILCHKTFTKVLHMFFLDMRYGFRNDMICLDWTGTIVWGGSWLWKKNGIEITKAECKQTWMDFEVGGQLLIYW